MKDDSTIGAQIRDLRRRRGLTQEDLAAKAGLSRDVIKKIESGGSARMSTYHAIARALGVVTLTFAAPRSPEPVPAAHNDAALAEPVAGTSSCPATAAERAGLLRCAR